jgi:hypothetical protein
MFTLDVSVILLQRLWQALAGLVTMTLIAHFLTPVQQGWYYSFLSLAALYTLFDLGLSVVLLQISAHYSISISWLPKGGVTGNGVDRYSALLGRSTRLYLCLSLVFFVMVFSFGLWFFWAKNGISVSADGQWWKPWGTIIFFTALNILFLPIFALVEGSGRVHEVYTVRFAQGVLGSLACWLILTAGGGLWAAVMLPGMGFLAAMAWLIVTKPILLKTAWRNPGKQLVWRHEIWPFQWRVGITWISNYMLTQIYTPILFTAQGPVTAGQMGLSLTVVNMLGLLSHSFITQRIPAMAHAVGRQDWYSLDCNFKRDITLSISSCMGGGIILCGMHVLIGQTHYAERILPFWPFVGLLGVTLVGNVNAALVAHMRSFCREPFSWVSLCGALLTCIGSIWGAGEYGAGGVVAVMLCVHVLFLLPLFLFFWQKINRTWRNSA